MTQAATMTEQVARAICEAETGRAGSSDDVSLEGRLCWQNHVKAAEAAIAALQGSAALPSEAEREAIVSEWWTKLPVYDDGGAPDRASVTRDRLAEIVADAMRAATPTAPVQDDDAELADDLRYIAACHTKDPRDEDRIYEAADRLDALSRLSPTPDTGLIEALEWIRRENGKGPNGLIDWQRCVDRIQEIASQALANAAPAQPKGDDGN